MRPIYLALLVQLICLGIIPTAVEAQNIECDATSLQNFFDYYGGEDEFSAHSVNAITTFVAETGFPTIAHHHDFYWERDRFKVNAVGDFLLMSFPPVLPAIQHVTINSIAQRDLSHRCGASSILVPNVLDFENDPREIDDFNADFRHTIGLAEDDILFLQPTRVVPRKGIEHAIGLIAALRNPKCKLVITHESGDEGDEYQSALAEMAENQGVDLRFAANWVGDLRDQTEDGRKTYDLGDAYAHADFITYPSIYEGFGNALIEAFYYRKPVLVNYRRDSPVSLSLPPAADISADLR